MLEVVNQYQKKHYANPNKLYVFLVDSATKAEQYGYSAFGQPFIYIFADRHESGIKDIAHTIAHEIGHAAFTLEHPPIQHSNNLMDSIADENKTEQNQLWLIQWDVVHGGNLTGLWGEGREYSGNEEKEVDDILKNIDEYIKFEIKENEIYPGLEAKVSIDLPDYIKITEIYIYINSSSGTSIENRFFSKSMIQYLPYIKKFNLNNNEGTFNLNWSTTKVTNLKLPFELGVCVFDGKRYQVVKYVQFNKIGDVNKQQIAASNITSSISNWISFQMFLSIPETKKIINRINALNKYIVVNFKQKNDNVAGIGGFVRISTENQGQRDYEVAILD